MFIVLIGPDGSGKTSLAKSLNSKINNSIYFHFTPTKKNINNFDLNTIKKNNVLKTKTLILLSIPRMIFKIIYINLVCKIKFNKWGKENKVIIGDRFLYNYFLDPESVKYYSSKKLAKYFVEKVLIKPDLVIFLKATEETILKRKNELTQKQIINFNQLSTNLNIKNLKIVNAENEFDIVLNEIENLINEKNL